MILLALFPVATAYPEDRLVDLKLVLAVDASGSVDQQEFARARLFDMLVGDWDRHEGQWRWKEQKTEKSYA